MLSIYQALCDRFALTHLHLCKNQSKNQFKSNQFISSHAIISMILNDTQTREFVSMIANESSKRFSDQKTNSKKLYQPGDGDRLTERRWTCPQCKQRCYSHSHHPPLCTYPTYNPRTHHLSSPAHAAPERGVSAYNFRKTHCGDWRWWDCPPVAAHTIPSPTTTTKLLNQ